MSLGVEILWPPTLALVFWRSQQSGKVLEPSKDLIEGDQVAYQLGFSKEEIIWGKVEIEPNDHAQDILGLSHVYKCPIWGSYYLPRVIVRPLEGKMLPKGIIHIHLDSYLIAEGEISSFLPDLEKIDCLESYSWLVTKDLFRAHTLTEHGADGNHQIGFMMPNFSKLEVQLARITAEEKMTLEIGLLSAYYSTKADEIKGKKP